MTRWFTSDLHLGHDNIIRFCDRPYTDVDEMNADLVRRYNEVVGRHDTVWILGDLCMGKLLESLSWVKKMHGTKYLVPGNHDRMFKCQGMKYTNTVQPYLDAGIAEVTEHRVQLAIPTSKPGILLGIMACHFPYSGDSKDGHEDRFQEHRPKDRGEFLVHGHTHGKYRKRGRMIDVGVDAWGGYPVSFETVVELFASGEDAEVLPWVR